jgi:hypothetical protein
LAGQSGTGAGQADVADVADVALLYHRLLAWLAVVEGQANGGAAGSLSVRISNALAFGCPLLLHLWRCV